MSQEPKDQKAILQKLDIASLNQMQVDVQNILRNQNELILLSPTGTGKTLAFLLSIIGNLEKTPNVIQVMIIVPSRELAIQVESVTREMGSGHKVNAIYGGRSNFQDKMDLKELPTIMIGTPGRLADHLRRDNFDTSKIKTLVLDEFDKSLEIGFSEEMKEIIERLPNVKTKILCSATDMSKFPAFIGMHNAKKLNFLKNSTVQLSLKKVEAEEKDKLNALVALLSYLGNSNGIVFCNFRATVDFVSDHLYDLRIGHSCFFGGMEQSEREEALIKFRNGTTKILVATDLAARGIDVPQMDYIIHYQLPMNEAEFTHRNGRTARMHASGTAYAIQWKNETVPPFLEGVELLKVPRTKLPSQSLWCTLLVSAGRRDKISKGDIAGFFFKKGQLKKDQVGHIELKPNVSFVAVPYKQHKKIIAQLNDQKLKNKKVRVRLV